MYQYNVEERVINTFKYHFILVLCSTNTNSPMQDCCSLL